MAIGKRGIIFSFMALLAIGLILFILLPQETELSLDRANVVKSRIQAADEYVQSIREVYLPGMLRVSSFKTLNALSVYTGIQKRSFLDKAKFTRAFEEVLLNGTVDGTDINTIIPAGIYDKNLTRLMQDLQNASNRSLLIITDFNFKSARVDIYQANATLGKIIGPWQVAVNFTINYSITTEAAQWNRTDSIVSIFSIEGLPDPLYLASTGGVYSNTIRKTKNSTFNLESFKTFRMNSSYSYENSSPSFLSRYYNDTHIPADGCCGIESFVNETINEYFSPLWLPDGEFNGSFVDCNYFGGECTDDLGLPPYIPNILNQTYYVAGITIAGYKFKIDQYRAYAKYNLTPCNGGTCTGTGS
ncbi:MAG: hypothetical protein AABX51_03720 [Nanoarchaeota archaeon]